MSQRVPRVIKSRNKQISNCSDSGSGRVGDKLQLSSHGSNMLQWIHIQLTSRLIWIAGHTFGNANWILNTNIFDSQAVIAISFRDFCWLIVLFLFWLHSNMPLPPWQCLTFHKRSFPPDPPSARLRPPPNEWLRQRTCCGSLAVRLH